MLHASEPLGVGDVLWLLGSPLSPPGAEQLQRWRTSWRMSWEELKGSLDQEAELAARRATFFLQAQSKTKRVLMEHSNCSLLPLIRSAALEGYHKAMLETLDEGETYWQGVCVFVCLGQHFAPLIAGCLYMGVEVKKEVGGSYPMPANSWVRIPPWFLLAAAGLPIPQSGEAGSSALSIPRVPWESGSSTHQHLSEQLCHCPAWLVSKMADWPCPCGRRSS